MTTTLLISMFQRCDRFSLTVWWLKSNSVKFLILFSNRLYCFDLSHKKKEEHILFDFCLPEITTICQRTVLLLDHDLKQLRLLRQIPFLGRQQQSPKGIVSAKYNRNIKFQSTYSYSFLRQRESVCVYEGEGCGPIVLLEHDVDWDR